MNRARLYWAAAPVDEELTAKLQSAQGAVYASYGMTETLSHVALRRLNGPTADAGFRALPGVTISLSALNTLQIEAPAVAAQTLITHDRARFNPDGTFSLIGRLDNVINTGAVKIQIEEVEAKLKPFISGRFAVSARKSRLFGEEVVLVLEGAPALLSALDFSRMRQALGRFERPHWVICTSELPLTGSGKPDRPAIRKAAETLFAEPWTALEAGAASNIIGSRWDSFSTGQSLAKPPLNIKGAVRIPFGANCRYSNDSYRSQRVLFVFEPHLPTKWLNRVSHILQ